MCIGTFTILKIVRSPFPSHWLVSRYKFQSDLSTFAKLSCLLIEAFLFGFTKTTPNVKFARHLKIEFTRVTIPLRVT